MTKEQIKSAVVKHKIDIIVVASLLLLSIIMFLVGGLTKEEGATVEVRINLDLVAEYPLDKDGVYTLNGGTNVLTVKDGVAYMSYSECKGHQCEKMGKVKYVGEFIECAPNHIKIVITGTTDDALDFVS